MADHLAAPTALEEHRRLAVFAGEWTGEEMVYPSRWTAGGPATSHVVARMDLNGFYLIQDTRQMRDGKETFATHGVFTYDRDQVVAIVQPSGSGAKYNAPNFEFWEHQGEALLTRKSKSYVCKPVK